MAFIIYFIMNQLCYHTNQPGSLTSGGRPEPTLERSAPRWPLDGAARPEKCSLLSCAFHLSVHCPPGARKSVNLIPVCPWLGVPLPQNVRAAALESHMLSLLRSSDTWLSASSFLLSPRSVFTSSSDFSHLISSPFLSGSRWMSLCITWILLMWISCIHRVLCLLAFLLLFS